MKRRALALAVMLIGGFPSSAQEAAYGPAAFAFGLEVMNMNAPENFAMALTVHFDYNLGRSIAVGFTASTSRGFDDFAVYPVIGVQELGVLFRMFIPGGEHRGFFLQADFGGYFAQKQNETGVEYSYMIMGGIRGGYRLLFGQFYIEPYARAGYPFIFGVGVLRGARHVKG
jgi:hypothetical protein